MKFRNVINYIRTAAYGGTGLWVEDMGKADWHKWGACKDQWCTLNRGI